MSDHIELREEDFDHIWLRHKEKMRNLTLLYLTIFALATSFGLWLWVDKTASSAINSYIETDGFRSRVVEAYQATFDELNLNIETAEKTISEIKLDAKALSTIPYSFNENGFSLSDANGDTIYIEFGTTKGQVITFTSPFTTTPALVFATFGAQNATIPGPGIFSVNESQAIISRLSIGGATWIAVGR